MNEEKRSVTGKIVVGILAVILLLILSPIRPAIYQPNKDEPLYLPALRIITEPRLEPSPNPKPVTPPKPNTDSDYDKLPDVLKVYFFLPEDRKLTA